MPLELLLPVPLGVVELEPLELLFPEPVAPEDELVDVLELLFPVLPLELELPVPTLPEDEPLVLLFPVPVPPEGEVTEEFVDVLLLSLLMSVLELLLLEPVALSLL